MRSWLRLASHLHVGLQRCQDEHTSTELLVWMLYLDEVSLIPTIDQYYYAQIAAEEFRSIAKNPEQVSTEQFLIKFKKEERKEEDEEEEEVVEQTEEEITREKAAKHAARQKELINAAFANIPQPQRGSK